MAQRIQAARQSPGHHVSLTINLTNGDEIEVEGETESLEDVGAAVERLIRDEGELKPGEQWSSLVIVVV